MTFTLIFNISFSCFFSHYSLYRVILYIESAIRRLYVEKTTTLRHPFLLLLYVSYSSIFLWKLSLDFSLEPPLGMFYILLQKARKSKILEIPGQEQKFKLISITSYFICRAWRKKETPKLFNHKSNIFFKYYFAKLTILLATSTFLTLLILPLRNFLPFNLPLLHKNLYMLYIPLPSIFLRYTSPTFPLLLSLVFFVSLCTQFFTPLPSLRLTPPLVLAASNRSSFFSTTA